MLDSMQNGLARWLTDMAGFSQDDLEGLHGKVTDLLLFFGHVTQTFIAHTFCEINIAMATFTKL